MSNNCINQISNSNQSDRRQSVHARFRLCKGCMLYVYCSVGSGSDTDLITFLHLSNMQYCICSAIHFLVFGFVLKFGGNKPHQFFFAEKVVYR
jgi:hypothetical protein